MASEHAAHVDPDGTKASKGDGDDSDSGSDSDSKFGKTLKAKGKAPAKKKKIRAALFGVKWWRVVLGMRFRFCSHP